MFRAFGAMEADPIAQRITLVGPTARKHISMGQRPMFLGHWIF